MRQIIVLSQIPLQDEIENPRTYASVTAQYEEGLGQFRKGPTTPLDEL